MAAVICVKCNRAIQNGEARQFLQCGNCSIHVTCPNPGFPVAPVVGGILGLALTPILVPAALGVIGFGSAGVAAGSIAAAIQGPAVASGSLFAICQSIGATGAIPAAWVALGGAAGAAAGANRSYCRCGNNG